MCEKKIELSVWPQIFHIIKFAILAKSWGRWNRIFPWEQDSSIWKPDNTIAIKSKSNLSWTELTFCKGVEFVLKTFYAQIFFAKMDFRGWQFFT